MLLSLQAARIRECATVRRRPRILQARGSIGIAAAAAMDGDREHFLLLKRKPGAADGIRGHTDHRITRRSGWGRAGGFRHFSLSPL
jgi:hypothetical protein